MYRKSTDGVVLLITIAVFLTATIATVGSFVRNSRSGDTTKSGDSELVEKSDREINSQPPSIDSGGGSDGGISLDDTEKLDDKSYKVESVIDGDTIKIMYEGRLTSVRLIGVNTPETVDSRTTVECFGVEASNYLKSKLSGKTVRISADSTQGDRDKYSRLLRYVYLDGEDVGLSIISGGYGHEYTYNLPYAHQAAYKKAQSDASANNRGLWAPGVCDSESSSISGSTPSANQQPQSTRAQDCRIKGNISQSSGAKIYHVPGQKYYDSTVISEEYGERWFCSEAEAQNAGWRKSRQ